MVRRVKGIDYIMFFFPISLFKSLNKVFFHIIFQITNKFPPSLCLDYSCMDNIKKLYLEDTPYHVCESLSLVASNIYNLYPFDIKTSGSLLHGLAKQNSTKISLLNICWSSKGSSCTWFIFFVVEEFGQFLVTRHMRHSWNVRLKW